MKEVLLKWVKLFYNKEKEEYIQLLKNYHVYDLIFSSNQTNERRNTRCKKSGGYENLIETTEKRFSLKRPHRHSKQQKIVEAANFELLKYVFKGRLRTKLTLFPIPDDRKYCYEYYWNKSVQHFACCGCHKNRKYVSAKIIKRNGKDVIRLNGAQHTCELREQKNIIENQNFKVITYEHNERLVNRLVVFLNSSHILCYEYYMDNATKSYYCCECARKHHCSGAHICQKGADGKDFVILKLRSHVCEPRKFNPEKYDQKEIVEASKYKLFKIIRNGVNKSKLVIFASPDKSACYEYYWHNSNNLFICSGCDRKKKSITAKVCSNLDGSNYLKLNKKKHFCEPCEYNPEKFSKEIMESKNFKIFYYNHNGNETSKLIIFCETNKNLCYEYSLNKHLQKYYCTYCPIRNQVTATVCQEDDSKDYLLLSKTQHGCNLLDYDSNKYKDDIIIQKSMYNSTSTVMGNIKNKVLTLFTSSEKKFYYKFIYDKQRKCYFCSKCYYPSKLLITATIENDGNEDEFLYVSNQKHVCEPLVYSAITNGNIVVSPNFQLVKRKVRGKIIQHLVIFTFDEKIECYDYTWQENRKSYLCLSCVNYHKIYVYATIFKNDANEECVELSESLHKCKPIKFVPENITPKIVKLPDFNMYEIVRGKKRLKRLALLDSENRNMGYIYSYRENWGYYVCIKCSNKKKYVTAKVFQDENGENCVEIIQTEHFCELQKI